MCENGLPRRPVAGAILETHTIALSPPAGPNTVGAILTGYAADGSVVGHSHVGAHPCHQPDAP